MGWRCLISFGEWMRGQVDEQVGGEEKEQGVGCGVSLIFGMQSLKK